MEEVKSPRNKLDIEVNVETDEAEVKLERLKEAAEGCTKAFEELGDTIANVGSLLSGSQEDAAPIEITTLLDGKKLAECARNSDRVRENNF
ncbi:hypothetical protein P4W10_16270 [Bacillus thuringiensis]|uniref:hypothetical protein n=1 Tax=Bacillus thuringiensis TaxID=1428 RepID=UPI002DBCFDB0|nr:hypothetical protein [Bacillus thuringiensis]MEC3228223.1 hypothetical protein [Bacillus thuringiensis]MEC3484763.1 hypothetical protein [Bacillus thuringiensis]MED2071768.1 hypothetical protein [Bacillus thuringiensis]MED2192175.1 hypothetical protein [Bacillus thuringiensis]MED2213121.1 hypothetical protein [Bacillus thuringiensis]